MEKKHLNILWTSVDAMTARHMVMMYATNSMLSRWWDSVTVIVWGAASQLVAQDADIQESIRIAEHAGVQFSACIACARQLGVVRELTEFGMELKPWGEPLTKLLKEDEKLITI